VTEAGLPKVALDELRARSAEGVLPRAAEVGGLDRRPLERHLTLWGVEAGSSCKARDSGARHRTTSRRDARLYVPEHPSRHRVSVFVQRLQLTRAGNPPRGRSRA